MLRILLLILTLPLCAGCVSKEITTRNNVKASKVAIKNSNEKKYYQSWEVETKTGYGEISENELKDMKKKLEYAYFEHRAKDKVVLYNSYLKSGCVGMFRVGAIFYDQNVLSLEVKKKVDAKNKASYSIEMGYEAPGIFNKKEDQSAKLWTQNLSRVRVEYVVSFIYKSHFETRIFESLDIGFIGKHELDYYDDAYLKEIGINTEELLGVSVFLISDPCQYLERSGSIWIGEKRAYVGKSNFTKVNIEKLRNIIEFRKEKDLIREDKASVSNPSFLK